MTTVNNQQPYFRPGIAIFAQEQDNNIYKHFLSVITSIGIAEPLRQSIGIINVHSEATNTTNSALLVDYWTIKKMSFNQREIKAPTQPNKAPLTKALQALLYDIASAGSKDNIEQHGYVIDNTTPHIFIVGSSSNLMLGKILQQVHLTLPQSPAYYILCSPDNTTNTPEASTFHSAILDQQRIAPNFCFLYKPYVGDPQFGYSRPEQHCYAAAQALYTLLVTGITEHQEMKLVLSSSIVQNRVTHFGTLSTCLITTPGRAVQTFCEYYLVNQFTNWWKKESKDAAQLPPELQKHLESIDISNNTNPGDIFDLSDDSIKQILTTIKPTSSTNHTKANIQEELKKIEEAVNKRLLTSGNSNMNTIWKLPNDQSIDNRNGLRVFQLYLCELKDSLENLPTLDSQNATLHETYDRKLKEVIENTKPHLPTTNATGPTMYIGEVSTKQLEQHVQQLHQQVPAWQVRIALSILIVVIVSLLGFSPQIPVFMWAWFVAIIIIYIVIANIFYARYCTRQFWRIAEPIYKALITTRYIQAVYTAKQQEYQTQSENITKIKKEIELQLQRCNEIIDQSTQVGQMNSENQLEQAKEAFFKRLETLHDVYLTANGYHLTESRVPNDSQTRSLEDFANSLFIESDRQEAQKEWNAFLYQWMEDTSKPIDKNAMEDKAKEIILRRIVKAPELSQHSSASIIISMPDVSRRNTSPLNAISTTIWDYIRQNKLARKYASFPTEPQPLSVFLSGREQYLALGQESLQKHFQNVIVSDTEGKNDIGVFVAALYNGAIPDSIDYNTLSL